MSRKSLSPRASKSPAGFTLVELLVVIVIIAALAGIAFPMAAKMKERASDNKCAENLKNWGTSISLYAAENGGSVECRKWNALSTDGTGSVYIPYMTGDSSGDSRGTKLDKIRCCPALKGEEAVAGNGNSATAYCMTDPSAAGDNTKNVSYNLSSIKNPTRFVIMIEATNVGNPAVLRTTADFTSKVKPLTVGAKIRHKPGVVNALMGDFSLKTFNAKEVDQSIPAWTTF